MAALGAVMFAAGLVCVLAPVAVFLGLLAASAWCSARLALRSRVTLGRLYHYVPHRHVLNAPRSQGPGAAPGVGNAALAVDFEQAALALHRKCVDPTTGCVDYDGMPSLNEYARLCDVARRLVTLTSTSFWPLAQQVSFWVNAYNMLMWMAMVELRPRTMMEKLEYAAMLDSKPARATVCGSHHPHGLLRSVFQSACFNVGGVVMSLDEIEHGVLRANRLPPAAMWPVLLPWDITRRVLSLPEGRVDARIHFALNCASTSCPRVLVYSARNLDMYARVRHCSLPCSI